MSNIDIRELFCIFRGLKERKGRSLYVEWVNRKSFGRSNECGSAVLVSRTRQVFSVAFLFPRRGIEEVKVSLLEIIWGDGVIVMDAGMIKIKILCCKSIVCFEIVLLVIDSIYFLWQLIVKIALGSAEKWEWYFGSKVAGGSTVSLCSVCTGSHQKVPGRYIAFSSFFSRLKLNLLPPA